MDMPSGTVSFLFTDIEGSTRLWEERAADMRVALKRHDDILKNAIDGTGGVVFKTGGDAFFGAFWSASAALRAAFQAQKELRAESWPGGLSLRVRMALHAGECEHRELDYFGPALNRLSRLLSTGHGGQIILSAALCELAKDEMPEGSSTIGLGEHRLRDLGRPETIFQLVHRDLDSDFPPLRSLDSNELANNLPTLLTSFIGREKEITEMKSLLKKARLLTLTGSGGCGKTRLALQATADLLGGFADGVWFVELASLRDGELLAQKVGSTLGLREQQGPRFEQSLLHFLRNRELLLLLDNCEHLVEPCARLCETLLLSCPRVRILATSREALGIAGELAYRVPPMKIPEGGKHESVELLSQYESVRLFVDRALSHVPDFCVTNDNAPAVAGICARLEGTPLAIELAAARTRTMAVEEIFQRLDHMFRLLTGGSRTALPRHQTLRAMIDWSYDLLPEQERLLLQRLSVFAGGASLEAIGAICSDELVSETDFVDRLGALVEKNLVVFQQTQVRYSLLETVRQYAMDRLAEEGGEALRCKGHRDYFLQLLGNAEQAFIRAEGSLWMESLEAEHDNLRAALDWSLDQPDGAEAALLLCGRLRWFWDHKSYLEEGRKYCASALAKDVTGSATPRRASALGAAGILALCQGDYPAAQMHFEQSVAIRRVVGDQPALVRSLTDLGGATLTQGNFSLARASFEEAQAVSSEIGHQQYVANSLANLGNVARDQKDYGDAARLYNESLKLYRSIDDRIGAGGALAGLGTIAFFAGDLPLARSHYEKALDVWRDSGSELGTAFMLFSLGNVALDLGEPELAQTYFRESLPIVTKLGNRQSAASVLTCLGRALAAKGEVASACDPVEEGLRIRLDIGDKEGIVRTLRVTATLCCQRGDSKQAARLAGAVECQIKRLGLQTSPDGWTWYERAVSETRDALNEDVFREAFDEGQSIDLERAAEIALSTLKDLRGAPEAPK